MSEQCLRTHIHPHDFLGDSHERNERRTWMVVGLTAVMMIAEITCGLLFNSMALLADGWHMATHAGALAIAGFAYRYARSHARDSRFSFGTGKIGDLAGYTNAVVLCVVSLFIAYESVDRLINPLEISFGEAMVVAVVGLVVNVASAFMLHDGHHHHHDHEHEHDHDHDHGHHEHAHHTDHNLRAAYLHVIADALTSVAAILALAAGRWLGWAWMDPLMGVVGAVVIAKWAVGLLKETGKVLVDVAPADLMRTVRKRLEGKPGEYVSDLHLWRVGPGHYAAVVGILSHAEAPTSEDYKRLLADVPSLSHVTVEVQRCPCVAGKHEAAGADALQG